MGSLQRFSYCECAPACVNTNANTYTNTDIYKYNREGAIGQPSKMFALLMCTGVHNVKPGGSSMGEHWSDMLNWSTTVTTVPGEDQEVLRLPKDMLQS